MKLLLDQKYAPTTFKIGFLEAPFETVIESFVAWRRETRQKVKSREITGSLPALLKELEPLTMPPCRDLLVFTRGAWTAFFDNSAKTADPASPIGYMCTRIKCRGVVAASVPHTISRSKTSKGTYGAVSFELFSSEQQKFLNYERSICTANDGGRWMFIAEGKVQSFEETDTYKKKSVRDRFTPEMLERYCKAMGISMFDSEFFGPIGQLVESE